MRDVYLWWAIVVTAGSYLGSRYFTNNLFIYSFISIIFLLLVAGLFMVKKLTGQDDSKNDRKSIFIVLIVISTIIFLFLGYITSVTSVCRENKNILYLIYRSKNYENANIFLEGRVIDYPKFRQGNLYFSLKIGKASIYDKNCSLYEVVGLSDIVDVRVKNCYPNFLERDDYIKICGKISPKAELTFVADCKEVTRITVDDINGRIFRFRKRIYECLSNTYYRNLSFTNACVCEALILGNRNNIPEYLLKNFKKSGVFHLLAISGLHISILMYFLITIARKLDFFGCISWLIIVILFVYNFVVGERASILRATVMAIFIVLANKWNREYSLKIILYFSYIFLILARPSFLYELGFWMSFGSIAAIIFVSPIIVRFLKKVFPESKISRSYIGKIFISTISIQIFLFPLLSHFFGEISTVSIISNLLVIPVFYIVLLLLFFSSILSLIWPPLGEFIVKADSVFISYIIKIAGLFGDDNFSQLHIDYFPVKYVIIYYIVLSVLLLVFFKYSYRTGEK